MFAVDFAHQYSQSRLQKGINSVGWLGDRNVLHLISELQALTIYVLPDCIEIIRSLGRPSSHKTIVGNMEM